MVKRKEIRKSDLSENFAYWEKTKYLIDQLFDIILNYRQSGHPGGSRSKVHVLIKRFVRDKEKRTAFLRASNPK